MRTGYGQAADDPGLPLDVLQESVRVKAQASGMKARAAAMSLRAMAIDAKTAGDEGRARALLEVAQDLLEEMHRWKDAWAHETVDKDRKVREAMARSESCAAHGEEIRQLRADVWHWSQVAERNEKARLALLSWFQVCRDFHDAAMARRGVTGMPSAEKILEWMKVQLPKVERAHKRAFSVDLPKYGELPPDTADKKGKS
jgi:hypothetical protein